MSQHLFKTQMAGQPVLVVLGWDRPLSGFFMLVASGNGPEADLYCNLDDEELAEWCGLPPTLDPFLARLKHMGIIIPRTMVLDVLNDKATNTGNRMVDHSRDAGAIHAV
jgi:hypothetical protein